MMNLSYTVDRAPQYDLRCATRDEVLSLFETYHGYKSLSASIYTERVNKHLCATTPFPAGHYEVAMIVPMSCRAVIAKRFEDAGWKVSFNLDTGAYADHFQLRAKNS